MFFKADGATTFKRNKDKEVVMRETERNKKLAAEAQQWKNLALQKVGSKMKITKRQFIGDHPIVRQRIEDVVSANFKELEAYFYNKLKQ